MKYRISALALALFTFALLFTGCGTGDSVASSAKASLSAIVKAFPDLTGEDNVYFALSAPGSKATLAVGKDPSQTADEDFLLITPLKPFTEAGLTIDKLGEGYMVNVNNLMVYTSFEHASAKKSFVEALFERIGADRSILTYDEDTGRYVVSLGNARFEFAKDYKTNEKDLVFVLTAAPLLSAGVDAQKLEGWSLEKDGNGADVLVLSCQLG